MSILITTYEGTHNHTLPSAATAMASTTSAAVTMLLSGSSSSLPPTTTTAAANQLHGLNYYLSDNSKQKPFYFPNTSISSSHPTITLDLTSSSSSSSSSSLSSSSISSQFNNRLLPSNAYSVTQPRFSSLNFSSLESNTLPISWSNGHFTYNNHNKNIGSVNLGTRQLPSQENNFYQSFMQSKNIPTNNSQSSLVQNTSHSTIAAAITSDPNFQSALAAALTSIIGGNSGNLNQFLPSTSTYQSNISIGNGNGCGSGLLNNKRPSSSNPKVEGGLMLLPPSSSLPFSNSKSTSTSPSENNDHAN